MFLGSVSQPVTIHSIKGKTWDVSKMNIIVVRAGDFAQFCNERDVLHQRRVLHILWLIMTT